MGKGKRNRENRRRDSSRVHARVVIGGTDFRHAVDLIRPALLYADHVTVTAPAAALLATLGGLRNIRSPVEQLDFIIAVVEEMPEMAGGFDLAEARQLREFLELDRKAARRMTRGKRERDALDEFYRSVDEMEPLFADKFGDAMNEAVELADAAEFVDAVDSGLVSLEPLKDLSSAEALSTSVKAVQGDAEGRTEDVSDFVDQMALRVLDALLDALASTSSTPVFDETASGLVRAFKAEGLVGTSHPEQRELTAASGLMTFLPALDDVPLRTVAELRHDLQDPLIRFRAGVTRIAAAFESEIYEPRIEAEIQVAWRRDVEPELLAIREQLEESGFLRSLGDVAMEKPSRLITEAVVGGAFAFGYAPVGDLSELLLKGLAAGLPVADAAGTAFAQVRKGRRQARRNDFYFLYGVEEALSRQAVAPNER